MTAQRLPALLIALSALGFMGWAIVMILSPAGSIVLEWIILGVSAAVLWIGVSSLRTDDPKRANTIRMFITAFAVFGAAAVIGLTADDSSSRTWVRLGWAALVVGLLASVAVWWNAPRVDRRTVMAGGVVGLVLLAGGFGITSNCDKSLQRSWCDPAYEQEEVLASRIEVSGDLERSGRAGGDTGAFVRAYLIEGTGIEASTRVPEEFAYEKRPLQSREVDRGRYRAASGPYSNCQIDVKVESVPAGNLETLGVTCLSDE